MVQIVSAQDLGRSPEDELLDLFKGKRRIWLWVVVVGVPILAAVLIPLLSGKVHSPGAARILGSPDVVLTGILLAIAGNYELAVTPLRTSRTWIKITLPMFSLVVVFCPGSIVYAREIGVPERLPTTLDLALVGVSFFLTTYLGSLAVWKAAKG